MSPHFETVRTDAGWHARFKGANGEIVWTTEVYNDVRDAENAVDLIVGRSVTMITGTGITECSEIDERTIR